MRTRRLFIPAVGCAACLALGALWLISLAYELRFNGSSVWRAGILKGNVVGWEAREEIRLAAQLRQVVEFERSSPILADQSNVATLEAALRLRESRAESDEECPQLRGLHQKLEETKRLMRQARAARAAELQRADAVLQRLSRTVYIGSYDTQSGIPDYGVLPRAWRNPTGWVVVVPLWTLIVLIALASGVIWWTAPRPVLPGHCQQCGYDLTGNVSGRCPECGTVIGDRKEPA